jgi:hypothetical protein
MDIELDNRLRAIEKKLDETHTMVRKMRGAQKRAVAVKLAYWAFLIILGIIAVSTIRPYIAQLREAYGLGENSASESAGYADLLKMLNE